MILLSRYGFLISSLFCILFHRFCFMVCVCWFLGVISPKPYRDSIKRPPPAQTQKREQTITHTRTLFFLLISQTKPPPSAKNAVLVFLLGLFFERSSVKKIPNK
eukprot:GEMP01056161.1.p2 GENE.GEMP01056161.1~~GEMP01056161.1.p2  ORF type:complete len:104 (-),score=8.61 GEMP01056161.1:259-570(-)